SGTSSPRWETRPPPDGQATSATANGIRGRHDRTRGILTPVGTREHSTRRPLPPMVTTLRLLPGASWRLSIALAALIVVTSLLPAAFALASGALIGSLGGAVAGGWGSPAGRRLTAAIAAVVGIFVLQQVSGPGVRAVADALGRRAEGKLRLRVMAATLRPAGVAHLEDPGLVDQVTEVQSVGTGDFTVKEATVGIAMVATSNLAAVLSAVVLAAYRWWLAAALLAVYLATTRVLADDYRRTVAALRGHARRFRRSNYFRDLAIGPAAAKELRVFGLAPWAADRFTDQWQIAMAAFWRTVGRAGGCHLSGWCCSAAPKG
ncbi:MAG TPA: hypothetical protein VGP53_06745, partial [Acidimicrobiales bacterium]|nr:hypothetical protein [Acidimicrobiales bacterium]